MKLFNRHLMRNLEATSLLELFFVTSVFSVLGIRFFLALTGYPILQPRQPAHRPCPFGRSAHDDRPGHRSRLHQQIRLLSGGRPGGLWIRGLHRRAGQVHHRRQRLLLPAHRGPDLCSIRSALPGHRELCQQAQAQRAGEADQCPGDGQRGGPGGSGSPGEKKGAGSAQRMLSLRSGDKSPA